MDVKLHYLDTSKETAAESLFVDGDEIKDKILNRLGIERNAGESHVDAWGRHLHDINGLPFTKPYHEAIKEAIMSDSVAYRFMFVLAYTGIHHKADYDAAICWVYSHSQEIRSLQCQNSSMQVLAQCRMARCASRT